MKKRITIGMLETLATAINNATGNHIEAYSKVGDKYVPNAGNYHISGAYGGYNLERMDLSGGTGTSTVFSHGHVPSRQLYEEMKAFLRGVHTKEQSHG